MCSYKKSVNKRMQSSATLEMSDKALRDNECVLQWTRYVIMEWICYSEMDLLQWTVYVTVE